MGGDVPTPDMTYEVPRPAPGVLPDGMAFDHACGQAYGELARWAVNGAFHEGLFFLGYPYLSELSQRAEYRNMAEIIAEHMVRKWIKIKGPEEKVKAIEQRLYELDCRDRFREAAEQDGLFGRSQIFLDFDDFDNPEELATPLMVDERKVSKARPLQRLKVVEPIWSSPAAYNTQNPLAPDFYKPPSWYVYGKTIDASRMLTFVSREVPDILKPAYVFGGLSMSQIAKPYVDNWLRTRQSVSDMVNAFSTMVLKTNMDAVLDGGSASNVLNRVDLYNQWRSNRGTMVIDKNTEDLENVAVPISGLDKLQAQAQEQMSSVSGIPLVILLGVTPSGLNASSDGEIHSFYANIRGMQEAMFRPNLRVVINLVQLSLFNSIDPEIVFEFVDLYEMKETDKAQIRKADADADGAYVTMGAVSNEEVRERLANDETGLYRGIDLTGPAPEPEPEEDADTTKGDE